MTDKEMVEYVLGCLKEIREAQRPWGVITVTVEGGNVKFVNVQKPPRYKLEDGQMVELQKYE